VRAFPNSFVLQCPRGSDANKVIGFDGFEVIAQNNIKDTYNYKKIIWIGQRLFFYRIDYKREKNRKEKRQIEPDSIKFTAHRGYFFLRVNKRNQQEQHVQKYWDESG